MVATTAGVCSEGLSCGEAIRMICRCEFGIPAVMLVMQYTGCFRKGGRSLRSEFRSPKVTKKFMYTLVAKAPVLSYNPLNIE
jgi:hypothetical protein